MRNRMHAPEVYQQGAAEELRDAADYLERSLHNPEDYTAAEIADLFQKARNSILAAQHGLEYAEEAASEETAA